MLEPTIIIGAGVLGLSTAYTVLTTHPKTPIMILAAELPTDPRTSWTPDYASMWAGAHYRPIAPSTPEQHVERAYAMKTYAKMRYLAQHHPVSGVAILPGVEYLEKPGVTELALQTGDMYAGPGDRFRLLAAAELPEGVAWGCEYDTYCVNVTIYCQWLLRQLEALGARVVRRRLRNPEDAFSTATSLGFRDAKVVINCSGRGFDVDPNTYPIRGQTVLVRQQYWRTVTRQCREGGWSFLIPRPQNGGTIVGGTKEVGSWDGKVSDRTRQELLERAAKYFPDFVADSADFDVVSDNVGRRPARNGGLRAEVEVLAGRRRVVHGYGAGGRGYEISWGVAEELARLLEVERPLPASL